MSSIRNALRCIFFAFLFTLPLSAYAANYDVRVLFDTDANRSTGCTVPTANGPVAGVEQILTTSVTVNGGAGTVTGVTRQTCVNGLFFGDPVPVNGGWNVGVSSTGNLFIETHVGANVLTMTNIPTMRLAFTVTSGSLTDAMTTDFGDDILYPVRPGRRHAVSTGALRTIRLDGLDTDWNGLETLASGDAASPALRFLDASAFADLSDLFFSFHIQTNPNAPTALDDFYALGTIGGTLSVSTLGVLNNDSDPNNLPLSAFLVEGPEHGTLSLNANGAFTYTHDGSSIFEDHFRYRVTNGTLQSNLATVTISLPGSHPYTFTSADHVTFTACQPNTFHVIVTGNPTPALTEDGVLPSGITFTDNGDGTGTLSGTPAPGTVGTYPIVFHAEKNKPHQTDQNFTLTVVCGGCVTVTAPIVNTGTINTPFSQTFTQSGGAAPITWSESGALPAGLTFNTSTGVLSGTPTQAGTFPITVTATDASGCIGTAPYTLTIVCNSITVTNPVVNTGIVNVPFSQTFTQAGGLGPTTFSTASALPAGLTLSSSGVLSGTPTQTGSFTIVVTASDAHCSGSNTSSPYHLTIACQLVTVTNPVVNTGTVNVAFSQTFTAGNAIAPVTFTLNSGTLPAGITLNPSTGVLSGTPTQTGSFPITIKATDVNSCTGTGPIYTLTINCQVITVTNPATNTGTVNVAFSQTFTAGNAIAPVTFTLNSGTLPTGITLSSAGVLSGTPTQTGSFPITVKATDANSCFAVGGIYTLTINCQVISVTNPGVNTGTAGVAFSQTFTQSGGLGTITWSETGALPGGITLNTASGVLSGTTSQVGSFPITVTATDQNGCTGTGAMYTLTINCETVTVTNPGVNTGTVDAAFSQTFTVTGILSTVTWSETGALPAGITLNSASGVLSGTPTVNGSFPITVKATDTNGCFGTSSYTLTINCQTITVTNPVTTTGTVDAPFSQTFTQTGVGTHTPATFTLNSGSLPSGLSLSTAGVLSGTPGQQGSFPITVKVTDSNGCVGVSTTYPLVISCQTITVTNPATTTGTVNVAFSQTFTQSGVGTHTPAAFTTASTLPTGFTLSTAGVLSGTTQQHGAFPIVVTVTDANGCTGTGATYNLVINCQTITVTNPATTTGMAGAPFSQTFTQTGANGGATFTTASTLPIGLSLSTAGVLSGTPTQTGSFLIVVTVTDGNGCTGDNASSPYNLIIGCQTISVTNPATTTGTIQVPFSQTFTQTGAIGGATFSLNSGSLPAGLTLSGAGVLSGTPTVTGSFLITVKVTDGNGCTGVSATYNLVINCQTITVTNPATTTGTVSTPFTQMFTQTGANGTATFTTASTLPAGLTLATDGTLSGTPTQPGTFPIVVTVTDSNGCTGTGSTYTLIISCQTITVTNPATTSGPAGTPFSQTFTQSGGIGTTTFSESGALPTGMTFHTATGVLDGTPTQGGTFPITVTATDSNGCTGTGPIYNLDIICPTITVTNPATTTGTVGVAFSQTFTQSGGVGTTTFSESGALPTGLTFHTATGVLDGTPTQAGSFPITVTATDSNGCTGTGPIYTLVTSCPAITVTNPSTTTGTVGVAFSQTFTQSGGIGTTTFSESGALPSGMTFHTATGVLDGTPSQFGTFPITVTATDSNGCQGTGPTYPLVISCPPITVTNPGVTTGTVDAPFSQTFTQSGAFGTATFTTASTLPAGLTLSTAGVLSGTPTAPGSFSIVVTVTDSAGCTGTGSTYPLVINCQTITVTNPATTTGTVDAPFSQTFTQSGVGTHTPATFTINSGTLPSGLSLSTAGVLSGTPGQQGSFPITVKVTDANGCTGISPTYTLVIGCQTITVTNPGVASGTAGTPFSQTFTQSGVGTHTPATFTTASTLPTGFSLSTAGVLSGTTTQHGTFPIVVTVTDANGCTGTGATYNLVIACNAISVTNPVNTNGTVASPFSEQFTQSGVLGTPAFTTASTLPTGLTLHSATGILDGTPTQSGTFPITVTVTDSNGCTGTGAVYTLVIACNAITVTNPGVNVGTAGTPFSQTFTQSGGNGTIVWSETGALPSGISLNTSTGDLFGTTSQVGSFPITVTATDANGCQGTGTTYTLAINCQTVTVTNPGQTSVQAGVALDVAFTAGGILGTATWSETGDALPSGISLDSATGHLHGTTSSIGTFNIIVKATDTNGCFGTSAYTLSVTCPTITVTRNPSGAFPAGIFNTAYTGQSVIATGGSGSYTYAVTSGALPTGLSLSPAGAISGTPTATGLFNFAVTATDTASSCTGTSATLSISIAPVAVGDSYPAASHLVDNTQFVITGGTTTSPATPFVSSATNLITNDLPSGGVAATPVTNAATSAGGSVTIAADGTFIYTPKVNSAAAAITSDSFTYTVVSNGITSAPATVNLTLANRVWYVKNNGGGTNGQSQSPFTTLAAAQAASLAGDTIFVYNGDGTTANQTAGITLKANQQLIGEGVALVVNTVTLKAAGTKPLITNTAGSGVTLANGNTLKGLTITGASGNDIDGTTTAGLTIDTVTATAAGAASSALVLTTPSGAVTITNTTLSNSPFCLTINGGTAAFTMNNTNTITANATQRSINFANLGATAVVNVGASITDGGTGIQVATSAAGAQVSFTGTQTLTTTTNTAVNLSGNNATSVTTFSGTLAITTTTGSGFVGGAGILNVLGTANITSGAAAAGLSLNGTTIGGSGVTFNSVNTTGATTGINLVSFAAAGTVTVNGGTITNGTTGISLQGTNTSLTLAGVTITGPATGITNTTNFGTLTIGASVNVSAATALNLTTGAISGTFANVSSTGGTNGVNLNAVTGTWGATAGSLTGASGTTFNVTGGSGGTITWGPTITQANAALAVSVAGSNSNTINFGGSVTSQTAGTGITLTASSGTYNFNGGVAVSTGGVLISNGESGTVTFANGSTISSVGAAASFQVDGSVAAVTTAITYSGTITRTAAVGRIVDVNKLNTPGSLTMSHSVAAAGNLSGSFNGAPATASGISIINSSSTNISVSNASLTYKNIDAVTLSGNTGATITLNGLSVVTNGTGKGVLMSGAGTVNIGSGAAAPVINMSAGTNFGIDGTTVAFTGTLNLTNVAITGGGAAAVTLGGGTLGGTGSTITNAGPALVLSSVALTNGAGMTSITSSAGANGISLTSVTGGTYTVSGGSLSGNTGTAFLVSGGSSTFSYSGPITQNTAGQKAVNISGITGGTITLSGAIGSNGGAGISLAGTGGTITISGQITLNNTASVFSASGAGLTVNVTNANNTIGAINAVTTAAAINITNATIGASGVTFKSVSANGPANGIVLNNTGASGGLTIAGDGGASNNGSGGTIQNTTAEGILMTSTKSVSIGYMNITNPGTDGIGATGVNGLTINRCNLSDNAGNTTTDDGLSLSNTSGALSITNTSISAARHQGITIDNNNTNMTSMTITGSSITNTPGGDGILIQMRGTSLMTTGTIGGAGALANTISGNSATGLQVNNIDTGNITGLTILNNTITNNNGGIDLDVSPPGASLTVTVQSNTITGSHTNALNMVTATTNTGGSMTATLRSNLIGTAGVNDSGSAIGNGIRVANGGVNTSLTIDSNVIREVPNGRGIDIEAQAYSVQHNEKVKIINNTVARPSGTNQNIGCGANVPCPTASIFVLSDSNGLGGFDKVCTAISGNTVYDPTSYPAGGEAAVYFARRTSANNTLQLEGTQANAVNQITTTNTITNLTTAPGVIDEGTSGTVTIVAAGTCGGFPP